MRESTMSTAGVRTTVVPGHGDARPLCRDTEMTVRHLCVIAKVPPSAVDRTGRAVPRARRRGGRRDPAGVADRGFRSRPHVREPAHRPYGRREFTVDDEGGASRVPRGAARRGRAYPGRSAEWAAEGGRGLRGCRLVFSGAPPVG
ncbi:hypothetical protein GCM10010341_84760 [Streptomyces noursei]|nr:hypothetical protein GCM10010341_84760 [Streptomyces noursei]